MARASRAAALLVGVTLTVLVAVVVADSPRYEPTFGSEAAIADNFFGNVLPGAGDLPKEVDVTKLRFWQNYSKATGIVPGRFESPAFRVPVAELCVPLRGRVNAPGAGLYLQRTDSGETFWINWGAAHDQWQAPCVRLPPSFVGQSIKVIAFSQLSGEFVGVGTPYYRSNSPSGLLAFAKLFLPVAGASFYLLLLLLPFCAIVPRLSSSPNVLITALLAAGAGAMALFYIAWLSSTLGQIVCLLWLCAALLTAITEIARGRKSLLHPCLIATVVLTGFEGLFIFSFNLVSPLYAANYLFYPATWTTDNQLPVMLARAMASGSDFAHITFGPWKVSDRTPLLASLIYPAATVLRMLPSQVGTGMASIVLQVCGMAVNNSWLIVVATVGRAIGISGTRQIVFAVVLAASPLVFFNTIYIWPKLLAAIFCLVQLLYVTRSYGAFSYSAGFAAGLAGGLALMAHGSAVTAVAVIYVVAGCRHLRPAAWAMAAMLLGSCIIIVPWMCWRSLVAPTTDPLLRFFLTGNFGFDNPAISLSASVANYYSSLDVHSWISAKLAALRTLAGLDLGVAKLAVLPYHNPFRGFGGIRAYQFFFVLPCLGLLAVVLVRLLLQKLSSRAAKPDPLTTQIAGAGSLTLVAHFLMLAATHFLHHYPLFSLLALEVGTVAYALRSNSFVLRLLLLANYFAFIAIWIVPVVVATPVRSGSGLAIGLTIGAAATIYLCHWTRVAKPA